MSATRPTARPRRSGFSLTNLVILLVVLALAAGGGYFGYARFATPDTASAARIQTQPVRRGNVVATVSSTGTVAAVNNAKLSIKGGGYLTDVFVKVGDSVKAGQKLAKIDTQDLEISLRQQRANLVSAQAKLAQTLAGATEADIQAAISSVTSAQSQLVRSQADLSKLTAPPSADDVAAAAAALEKARNALQTAQTDYDRVSWRGDASSSQAVTLANATADYNSALSAYNLKLAPPKNEDVQAARASVDSAGKSVESANSKLAQLRAGPLPQDVAVARASVEQAAASVASAELNIERAVLTAPFDGVIQALTASPGEIVSAAFITLVDPNNLRLDVNVDENDVAKLDLNQPSTLTFDALNGRSYRGRVTAIAPTATVVQGVATYLISVQIDEPAGIKAGMTANVAIAYESRNNVLLVPNRAIRVQGRDRLVDVLTAGGAPETRTVRIGLANDQVTEISQGLSENEQVIIPTTGTRPGNVPGLPGGAPGGPAIAIRR